MFNLPVRKINYKTFTLNQNETINITQFVASFMILNSNPNNNLNIKIEDLETGYYFIYNHSNMFLKLRGLYNIRITNLSNDAITVIIEE